MAAISTKGAPAGGAEPAKPTGGQEAMLPAELGDLLPGDERLSGTNLQRISLFRSEEFEKSKNIPNFNRFAGTSCLRKCAPGRIICEQGAAGASAFYILTTEDVLELRRHQRVEVAGLLETVEKLGERIPTEIRQHLAELEREIAALEQRLKELPPEGTKDAPGRVAAKVIIATNQGGGRRRGRGLLGWLGGLLRGGSKGVAPAPGRSIAIDAPVGLKKSTHFEADLHEGQLFGEMSCLNRSPRSATVVATRECYLLEILRNVLDMLHKDPKFKARIDADYRQRVLQSEVRRLQHFGDVFDRMSPDEFEAVKQDIELVEYPAGAVLLEEGTPSDAIYIIRSGLAKVIKSGGYTLFAPQVTDKSLAALPGELAALAGNSDPLAMALWSQAPAAIQSLATAAGSPEREGVTAALNEWIQKGQAIAQNLKPGGRAVSELDELLEWVDDPQVAQSLASFPQNIGNWSEYEGRVFGRLVLEIFCPQGVPRRLDLYGPPVVLNYLGKGEVLGEIGVVTGRPRGATIIAFDHPEGYNQRIPDSRTGAVPSRIELIKLPAKLVNRLLDQFPDLRSRFGTVIEQREQGNAALLKNPAAAAAAGVASGGEFEKLGLVQGQRLMLIDLDRCTRCGACVEACIASHDDGNSRLFLDGMRIDKYLVPLTCRSCLDPVCMIGCPVGSIQRGSNLQIEIHNWCIGCGMCAEQCPYGSIQLSPIETVSLSQSQQESLPLGVELKQVDTRATVCDMCSSHGNSGPMCVHACPHDAAHRVSGRELMLDPLLFAASSGSER